MCRLPRHHPGKTASRSGSAWRNIGLKLEGGGRDYRYQDAGTAPVTVSAVNLDVENPGVSTPIDIKLTLAALGTAKNLSLTGKVGPLLTNGVIDMNAQTARVRIWMSDRLRWPS